MTQPPPSLYLVTPIVTDPSAFAPLLDEACAAGDVTAVLLRLAVADERTLTNHVKALAPVVQRHDAAALVADPGRALDLATIVARGGADGAHAADAALLDELRRRLKDGRNVGAGGLRTRHDAMVAGELGVDYVLFGDDALDGGRVDLDVLEEQALWWAEIFQLPCVALAPTFPAIDRLVRTGVEFIGLGDPVWSHPAGPGAAVAEARRLVAAAARESAA